MTVGDSRPFLVVIHDVTPVHRRPLDLIFDLVKRRIGRRFAIAVVPCWHQSQSPAEGALIAQFAERCDEVILHGLTHQTSTSLGGHAKWIGRVTANSNEFSGLTSDQIRQRLRLADKQLSRWVHRPDAGWGLVPPAWQLPKDFGCRDGLRYVMRFAGLEWPDGKRSGLATWSFDWGRPAVLAYLSSPLGHTLHRLPGNRVPCLVIHPADAGRGWLPKIDGLMTSFLNRGFEPTTPARLPDVLPC